MAALLFAHYFVRRRMVAALAGLRGVPAASVDGGSGSADAEYSGSRAAP